MRNIDAYGRWRKVIRSQTGLTLIELMAAVALLIFLAISIGLFLPKASTSIQTNHQLAIGTSLAESKLEEEEYTAYSVVNPTPASSTYFPVSGTTNPGGCNCLSDGDSINLIPAATPGDTSVHGDVTYTRHVCVNQLQGSTLSPGTNWSSLCPGTGWSETGLKYVHVRVSWTSKNSHSETHADVQGVIAQ